MKFTKQGLMLVIATLASTATPVIAQQPNLSTTVNQSVLFHHQIQNFDFNTWNIYSPDYMVMHKHALAMSYDAAPIWGPATLPAQYTGLKRTLNHNGVNASLSLTYPGNANAPNGSYNITFSDKNNNSLIDPSKQAGRQFRLDATAITNLIGFGCAKSTNYANVTTNSTISDIASKYNTNWSNSTNFTPVANFQSRYIAYQMVQQTIASLKTGLYDQMFIDAIGLDEPSCTNKDYGGWGSFATWKDGQMYFLNEINNAARTINGRLGSPIKVSGNIWTPYETPYFPLRYANNSFRLDHYFMESGGFAIQDISPVYHGLATNGADPSTGLAAYLNAGGGYIPANVVSVETQYGFHGGTYDIGAIGESLTMQHYNAAGVAAKQGSWFGFYGESQVDLRNAYGKLVHTNAMMLLRALPNWENIANTPLSNRWYTKSNNSYWSPNSQFSTSVIQSWNPINKTLYAVYMDTTQPVDLKGGTLKTAYFVDEVFNATAESAVSCLRFTNGMAYLTCGAKVRQGIRFTFQ